MQVRATARFVRVAPNKARQVMAHVRGLPVAEAQHRLAFLPQGASQQILKTLNSAVANAEHNHDLDADDLAVVAATVDEGPTLKRIQMRALGRAYRVFKRTSHITVVVGTDEDQGGRSVSRRRGGRGQTRGGDTGRRSGGSYRSGSK